MEIREVLWGAKQRAEQVPGASTLYRWITASWGNGRVYRIRRGPMKGLLWRRRGGEPFWYHTGLYEPEVSEHILANLRAGETFWDIGAHAGYHTLLGARIAGPSGKVLAVEPDPEVCERLRGQVRRNGFSNCEIIESCISDTEAPVRLIRGTDSRVSVIEDVAPVGMPGERLAVPATTLDDLAAGRSPPDLIKMDVEGAETLALPGGEDLLASPERPNLLISTHGPESAAVVRRFLDGHAYRVREMPEADHMIVGLNPARV